MRSLAQHFQVFLFSPGRRWRPRRAESSCSTGDCRLDREAAAKVIDHRRQRKIEGVAGDATVAGAAAGHAFDPGEGMLHHRPRTGDRAVESLLRRRKFLLSFDPAVANAREDAALLQPLDTLLAAAAAVGINLLRLVAPQMIKVRVLAFGGAVIDKIGHTANDFRGDVGAVAVVGAAVFEGL